VEGFGMSGSAGARRPFVACALVLAAASAASASDVETVRLETASGVFERSLPFDVPLIVDGTAPPGTARVEGRYEEKSSGGFTGTLLPVAPLVSGTDAAGAFRLQVPPLGPGRDFRFHLSFDRRLSGVAAAGFRASARSILDREIAGAVGPLDVDADRAARVQASMRSAYDRALNADRALATVRGQVTVRSADALLDTAAGAEAAGLSLRRHTAEVTALQSDLAFALERYRLTIPRLAEGLDALARSPELRRLLAALEAQPALDPRNPRSAAFLPPEAWRLLLSADAERQALAEGLGDSSGGLRLDDARTPEDAQLLSEQQERTARALRASREWLQALLGGPQRRMVEGLVAVSPADVDRLASLAATGQGTLSLSEQWAETLAAHARDAERALRGRERALDRAAAALEGEGMAAVTVHTMTTEPVSSRGGLYVSMDIGVLYPFEIERAAFYVGANVYLRPVNKQASLRQAGSLGHRLALTVGVTLTDTKLPDETRYENLLGERFNLVTGIGWRLTSSLRLSGGAMWFLKNSDNPLVVDREVVASTYLALSLDFDVAGMIRRASE
jgi:hypothetical protein